MNMMPRFDFGDAQQALAFLIEQASYIETTVYEVQYPDILYPTLIPVDSSANEWAKSITFFSMDKVGQADWFHHEAHDMRIADVERSKYEVGIEMAGIGYRYTLQELGIAMLIPGTNLTAERADAARRASEEFIDKVALQGDVAKGWEGLFNNGDVTRTDAAATGTGNSPLWSTKTAQQMISDVNSVLTGIYTASLTVEMADTVLMPLRAYQLLADTQMTNITMTALQWLQQYNVYTAQTNRPLMVRGVRGLETAGKNSTGRLVAYRRDPAVVKMHIPMPHKFMPVWQTGPLIFDVPGIFRIGGVEIRRPGAVRYLDGITAGTTSP
jgi:hypothetical protein